MDCTGRSKMMEYLPIVGASLLLFCIRKPSLGEFVICVQSLLWTRALAPSEQGRTKSARLELKVLGYLDSLFELSDVHMISHVAARGPRVDTFSGHRAPYILPHRVSCIISTAYSVA